MISIMRKSQQPYTYLDLKFLFMDKLQREGSKFDPQKEKIVSQKLIPVERFDPSSGKTKVVDVKVINYVVDKSGKIHVVFEGERTPNKTVKDKEEKNKGTLTINKDDDSENNKTKQKELSLEPEEAMTYMCSNGETNDGLIAKITPTESFLHVSFHEEQHLIARNIEAFLNDETIFLQYIRLFTRFDPATGKIFVAGGRAVTIKGKIIRPQNLFQEPLQHSQVRNSRALS